MLRLSLRLRVLLLLVAINVAVVGAEVAILGAQLSRNAEVTARDLTEDVVRTLSREVRPEGDFNVAPILQWPDWSRFQDAIILGSATLERQPAGRVVPRGVALTPVGRLRRRADVDTQEVYGAIAGAIDLGRAIDGVEGGRVVPIRRNGVTFGACWYSIDTRIDHGALILRYFLPAFLFSTVLLSAGTFVALRRFVLDPVDELARGARRMAAGDLSVRLREPGSGDEIAQLVRTFNAMSATVRDFNARLEREVEQATRQARQAEHAAMTQRRLAAMGELAAGIAHEINNPLGGLLNVVEALQRGDRTPERRAQYLGLLHGGLERMRDLVGQLLRFTPRAAVRAPVALEQPVRDALALVRHRASRQGVELLLCDAERCEPEESASPELLASLAALPTVMGEAHELAQAVLNLLVNALDALEGRRPDDARGPGRIHVRLRRSGAQLALEVADNGAGMAAADLARARDLFFTTKDPGKGTGLGLGIVHSVADRHGGTLELESQPGEGFRARILLPLEPPEARP